MLREGLAAVLRTGGPVCSMGIVGGILSGVISGVVSEGDNEADWERDAPSNLATRALVRPRWLYGAGRAGAGATASKSFFSEQSKRASWTGLVGEGDGTVEKREKNRFMVCDEEESSALGLRE